MESLRFNILWFLFGVTANIGFYFLESYALATLWGFCSGLNFATFIDKWWESRQAKRKLNELRQRIPESEGSKTHVFWE